MQPIQTRAGPINQVAPPAPVRFVGQLTELADVISREVASFDEKMMALHADYHATDVQKQKLIEEFVEKRNVAFDQYRDIIFAMRSQASAQEWEHLTE